MMSKGDQDLGKAHINEVSTHDGITKECVSSYSNGTMFLQVDSFLVSDTTHFLSILLEGFGDISVEDVFSSVVISLENSEDRRRGFKDVEHDQKCELLRR